MTNSPKKPNIMQDAPLREALRLLGTYTAGRFDIYGLAGPSKASCRAHVMSVLIGQKMPQAKSGITAIREEFYRRMYITGGCGAEREQTFLGCVKGLTAKDPEPQAESIPVVIDAPAVFTDLLGNPQPTTPTRQPSLFGRAF